MRRHETIKRPVPQDIRVYKTKLFGNLTTKQAIYAAAGIFIDWLIFNIFKDVLSSDSFIYIFTFVDAPIAAMALEPEGVAIDKLIVKAILPAVLNSGSRLSKTEIAPKMKAPNSNHDKAQLKREKKEIESRPELKAYK